MVRRRLREAERKERMRKVRKRENLRTEGRERRLDKVKKKGRLIMGQREHCKGRKS